MAEPASETRQRGQRHAARRHVGHDALALVPATKLARVEQAHRVEAHLRGHHVRVDLALLAVFDHRTPEEILKLDENHYFGQLGLNQHLSPQRRNGLFAMVKRVKQIALDVASQA